MKNYTSRKKRLLSLFIVIAFVLAIAPDFSVQAFAAEEDLPEISLFSYKFYAPNAFDCQRSPAYPVEGSAFRVSGFATPYDSTIGSQISFGTNADKYISFSWGTGATENDARLALSLYNADGTLDKVISNYGYLYGMFDEGFFYEGHGRYGYIFTSADFITSDEKSAGITFPASKGKITSLDDLIDYTPKETSGMISGMIANIDEDSTFDDIAAVVAEYEKQTDGQKAVLQSEDPDAYAKYLDIAADFEAVSSVLDLVDDLPLAFSEEAEAAIDSAREAADDLSDRQKAYFATTDDSTTLSTLETDYAAGEEVYESLADIFVNEEAITRADLDEFDNLSDGAKLLIQNTFEIDEIDFDTYLDAYEDAKAVEGLIAAVEEADEDALREAVLSAKEAYIEIEEMAQGFILDDELEALQEALVSLVSITEPSEETQSQVLSKAGGDLTIDLAGTDLDLMDIKFIVFDGENETEISAIVSATDDGTSGILTFPANSSHSDKEYTVKVVLIGPSGLETVLDEPVYEVTITKKNRPSSPATPTVTPPQSEVIIDGKPIDASEVVVDKDSGETKTIVDQKVIGEQILNAKENVTVVVPKESETPTAVAQLVAKNIDDMAKNDLTLSVQVDNIAYDLGAKAVDTKAIMEELGSENPADVVISVSVTTQVDEATKTIVENAISKMRSELVAPPMQFEINASYNGKTTQISEFSDYISRSIEVSEEIAKQITTGLIIFDDGTSKHVPTEVSQINGKWYAKINSLTNSTYVFILNEIEFADTAGKWYKSAANEMGSRKAINGVGENLFDGDRFVTRAEFAQIISAAFGLPTKKTVTFADCAEKEWYYDAVNTVAHFGIVQGVGDGLFQPNKEITRQEAMCMLQRAANIANFEGESLSAERFSDSNQIAQWAKNGVEFCVGSGLMEGFDGKLMPEKFLSRGEAATVVLRLLQNAELVDVRTQFN